ncbi:CHAD domain-containing protein [Luteolibacter ambystomatis]|uniref:CHAD domain-containing protein n=1 Tax=Luteolibacter ambystomatis TaxID=2824561 RepID=A0A975G6A3_9BACT|nr:CHAD domain-containing protein [Luteolibacter ambystomatis]QUE50119.1 CHAD domain-containing protein [Luteolibacter ambystomatis]
MRSRLVAECLVMEERLRGLLNPNAHVTDETHALRKKGKSLRGGLVLLRVPKSAARAVAAVGRLLGAPRDSVSRRTTWRRLELEGGPHAEEPSVAAIGALLEAHAKSAARRPPPVAVEWAEARLRHARAALSAISEEDLEKRVRKGRKALARRLEKRLKAVGHDPGAVELHEARKAIKAWLGALHHLGEEPEKELVDYADVLGDVNDLHVLATWLAVHGFSQALSPIPWRALEERLASLLETVLLSAPKVRKAVSAG